MTGLDADAERFAGGRLNSALAKAVVSVHNRYVGRGPEKGQAFFRGNVIVVLMEEMLTKAEHTLIEAGNEDIVMEVRRKFQSTMRAELVAEVERLTGCRVIAFMSDSHVNPDMAVEMFVLDRAVPGETPVT